MSRTTHRGGISSGTAWKRLTLVALIVLVAWWLSSLIRDGIKRDDLVAVDLGGRHHIGPDFNISAFYVNGATSFDVGREGGGGSSVCCVMLPKTWKPRLSVDLRWEVRDWTRGDPADVDFDNNRSRSFKHFRAKVPVERYEMPGQVEVHFFAEGKARVLVGWPVPYELRHANLPEDSGAADFATVGQPVDDLFTDEERNAARRRIEKREKSFWGNWQ